MTEQCPQLDMHMWSAHTCTLQVHSTHTYTTRTAHVHTQHTHTLHRLSIHITCVHTYSAKASTHVETAYAQLTYLCRLIAYICTPDSTCINIAHTYTDSAHLHTAHTCTHGLTTCRAYTYINMYRQHTHIHSLHVCTQSTCMQNPHVHMWTHTHICTTGGSTGRLRVSACAEHKDSGCALSLPSPAAGSRANRVGVPAAPVGERRAQAGSIVFRQERERHPLQRKTRSLNACYLS